IPAAALVYRLTAGPTACPARSRRPSAWHTLRISRAALRPQLADPDRDGLLVAESVRGLRVRLHLLLRALRAPLRGRARARRGQARRRRVRRLPRTARVGGVREAHLREGRDPRRARSGPEAVFLYGHTTIRRYGRYDRDRHSDRSLPARRASLQVDARGVGTARPLRRAVDRHHHQEPA